MIRIASLFLLLSLFFHQVSFAQKSSSDTAFVEDNSHLLGVRLYLSSKFTDIVLRDPDQGQRYRFIPNSGLNLGVGFTYQKFTLNAAMPLAFINPQRKADWPFYLDLQAHIYPTDWIIDLFGQFYNGYTLDEKYLRQSTEKYNREDLGLFLVGLNVNRLLNGSKISLLGAFNQSTIQRRSAISPFVGFEIYRGGVRGDSLLLPANEEKSQINFIESDFFQFGPNAGLAGTLVFGKGFFLTGVASANLSLGYGEWQNQEVTRKWGVVPTYFLRGFAGYNTDRFSINFNYVYKNLNLVEAGNYNQSVNTGNYRFNLVYKIKPSEKFAAGFRKINPLRIFNKDL